jgi:hypothetical protein
VDLWRGLDSVARAELRGDHPSQQPGWFRQGLVLVYVPGYDTAHLAAGYVLGASLAVVESISHPLRGWAMEVSALNIFTGKTTPDLRSDQQREQLERIHWYGNNGSATGFGKDQATRVLTQMKQHGLLDTGVVLGHLVAKDHHGKAVAARMRRPQSPCAARSSTY